MIRKMAIILMIIVLSPFYLAEAKQEKSQFKHERTGEEITIVRCIFDRTASFWIGTKEYTTGIHLIDTAIRYVKNIFSKLIYFSLGNENAELDLSHDKDFSFIISGLNTDEPQMKGNFGETPLNILWRTEDTIYLAELTPLKNAINYITLFHKRKIVIFSKQYEMLPGGKGQIFAYMSVGHFE